MQRLEVSGAVRLLYRSLGVKGLKYLRENDHFNTGGILVTHRMKILGRLRCIGRSEKRNGKRILDGKLEK